MWFYRCPSGPVWPVDDNVNKSESWSYGSYILSVFLLLAESISVFAKYELQPNIDGFFAIWFAICNLYSIDRYYVLLNINFLSIDFVIILNDAPKAKPIKYF